MLENFLMDLIVFVFSIFFGNVFFKLVIIGDLVVYYYKLIGKWMLIIIIGYFFVIEVV